MMRRFLPHLFIVIVTLIFAAVPLLSASAIGENGERPQIALRVAQASPGATIEVEGGRFEPDIMVKFVLFQNGTQHQLGTILADDHGEFLIPVFLPVELEPGQ